MMFPQTSYSELLRQSVATSKDWELIECSGTVSEPCGKIFSAQSETYTASKLIP